MEGKFRERSKGVWCPRPQDPVYVKDDIDMKLTGLNIGDIAVKAKKVSGWINMFSYCAGCEYCEEFHMDDIGVFCTYPNKASGD